MHHHLWRAVAQDGNVLDILAPRRRDRAAARKFFRRLLKNLASVSCVVSTDQLADGAAAKREFLSSVVHRQHQRLNHRAEHSHQPTRERERRLRRCKSPGHARRFLAAHGPIASHCRPRRHRLTAAVYRATRAEGTLKLTDRTGSVGFGTKYRVRRRTRCRVAQRRSPPSRPFAREGGFSGIRARLSRACRLCSTASAREPRGQPGIGRAEAAQLAPQHDRAQGRRPTGNTASARRRRHPAVTASPPHHAVHKPRLYNVGGRGAGVGRPGPDRRVDRPPTGRLREAVHGPPPHAPAQGTPPPPSPVGTPRAARSGGVAPRRSAAQRWRAVGTAAPAPRVFGAERHVPAPIVRPPLPCGTPRTFRPPRV